MLTGDYGMHGRDTGQPGAVGSARRRSSMPVSLVKGQHTCRAPTLLLSLTPPWGGAPAGALTRAGRDLTCLHWHTFWRVAAGPQAQQVPWVFTWGSGIPPTGP